MDSLNTMDEWRGVVPQCVGGQVSEGGTVGEAPLGERMAGSVETLNYLHPLGHGLMLT